MSKKNGIKAPKQIIFEVQNALRPRNNVIKKSHKALFTQRLSNLDWIDLGTGFSNLLG